MTIQEQIKCLLKELSKKDQVVLLNELQVELSTIEIVDKTEFPMSNNNVLSDC